MQIKDDLNGIQLLKALHSLRMEVKSRNSFKQVVQIARKRNCLGRDARAMMPVKPIGGVIIQCSDKNWEDFFPYSRELDEVVPYVVYNTSNTGSVSTFRFSDRH